MKSVAKVPTTRRVLLYGDVNLNILDGSAVWLVSMAEVLAKTNTHVTVLLKTAVKNRRLLERIERLTNVVIVEPDGDGKELSPREAAQRMVSLDRAQRFDHVIVRGLRVSTFVGQSDALGRKSWLYITDIPMPASKITADMLTTLRRTIGSCRRLFAQTEDARAYVESVVPEAAGKTLVLTPMIPDGFYNVANAVDRSDNSLSMVYSGKFAKNWQTLEMCALPAQLKAVGIDATLTMVGDKFQEDPQDREWSVLMHEAISSPGVIWLGGLSRDAALAEVGRHDIGLSWRADAMNASLEISTKVLEFAAAGVPPLINRNAPHERIFGRDYPLFTEGDSLVDVVNVLREYTISRKNLSEATSRAVLGYSVSSSAARIENYFLRAEADYSQYALAAKKKRVLLVGHDFKFAGELVESLQARTDIELRFDHWDSLHTHSPRESEALRDWADIVICEWCGPNAVWYSQNKRSDQKLIVRLHMFELRGPWMTKIDESAIDKLVCVSELYRERIIESTGWVKTDIIVIPNAIDVADLNRPKREDSRFRLGLVGIVPFRKRPDRALDVLEMLLEKDDRYSLHIRGRMPWEYSYEWNKPLQREAYMEFFERIRSSAELKKAVVFEPFGADMGNWLRKIGYVLSPSSDESFHLAPAEGMASAAVPIFWRRPGVSGIFGDDWTFENSRKAAAFIFESGREEAVMRREQESAVTFAGRFDKRVVENQWFSLLDLRRSKR